MVAKTRSGWKKSFTYIWIGSLLLLAASPMILSMGPDSVRCQALGYEGHYAQFHEPGLFQAMRNRSYGPDAVVDVHANAHAGLPIDDPTVEDDWSGHSLLQVDWNPNRGDEPAGGISQVTVQVDPGGSQAFLSVETGSRPGAGLHVDHAEAELEFLLGRLGALSQEQREEVIDDILWRLQGANGDPPYAVQVPIDRDRLRLGTLYRDMQGENMRITRYAFAGETEANRMLYTFLFRTTQVATYADDRNDHDFTLRAHSDGYVDVLRNVGITADSDETMSDGRFVDRVRDLVREMGVESPRLEGLGLLDRCGTTCVKCNVDSITFRAGDEWTNDW